MTYYRLKDNPGCVVREFPAWHAGHTGLRPLREVFGDKIDKVEFEDTHMRIRDTRGNWNEVHEDDYVFEHPEETGRLVVLSAENFEDTYKESEIPREWIG